MNYEQYMDLVKNRRSVRQYSSEPLPESTVGKIVEAAQYAPSGYNCQLWEFVVVDDPTVKSGVCDIIDTRMDAGAIRNAPVYIIALGDSRVREFGPFGAKEFDEKWRSIFYSSMAIAVEHMFLAAVSLGLSARWFSCYPQIAQNIKEYLNIPEYLVFYEMMIIGYADSPVKQPRKIRTKQEMVHYNICRESDFRAKDAVGRFFQR